MCADNIRHVRGLPGGEALPSVPAEPTLSGNVVWARDAYGSRVGIIAPVAARTDAVRWYLWDVDACGHKPATVLAGYFDTSDDAQSDWRRAVGSVATADAVFSPVDDTNLLSELLPQYEGFMRAGGEDSALLAEYHRSQRLAEMVLDALPPNGPRAPKRPKPEQAAREFMAWLDAKDIAPPIQDSLDEVAEELADSWTFSGPDALYWTCSPHRLALTVLHVRGYYQDEFADDLVMLLPHWAAWLAERANVAPHLAERCRPYAAGEPHPQVAEAEQSKTLTRVTE